MVLNPQRPINAAANPSSSGAGDGDERIMLRPMVFYRTPPSNKAERGSGKRLSSSCSNLIFPFPPSKKARAKWIVMLDPTFILASKMKNDSSYSHSCSHALSCSLMLSSLFTHSSADRSIISKTIRLCSTTVVLSTLSTLYRFCLLACLPACLLACLLTVGTYSVYCCSSTHVFIREQAVRRTVFSID